MWVITNSIKIDSNTFKSLQKMDKIYIYFNHIWIFLYNFINLYNKFIYRSNCTRPSLICFENKSYSRFLKINLGLFYFIQQNKTKLKIFIFVILKKW